MRTTKNWANIFLDEFHAAEIPAYTETGQAILRLWK